MIRQLMIALACVVGLAQSEADPAIIIGERATDLSSDDIKDISLRVGPDGPPWIIDVGELFLVKPPNLRVTAYLYPYMTSQTIRRGRAMWLHQKASEAREIGYEWHVSGGATEWAQVPAPGQQFGKKLKKPGKLDQLFMVKGKISDSDLVDLVRFIRTGPSEEDVESKNPDGSVWVQPGSDVDSGNTIVSMVAKGDCYFEVTTERRPGAGQTIEVIRVDGGWQVIGVSEWVV